MSTPEGRFPIREDGSWLLMRQDDNGNRYVVASYPSHGEADTARAQFEARGHKQTYWVEAKQPRHTTSES